MTLKQRVKKAVPMALAMTSVMALAAFADEGTGAGAAMVSALTPVKTEFSSTVKDVAPVGVGILSVSMIWKLGIRFIRSLIRA